MFAICLLLCFLINNIFLFYKTLFFRPIVYNCQLEKICGNGPNLFIIFEEDGSLQRLFKCIQVNLY